MMSISDEYMQEMVASMQAYTAVVLRKGPAYRIPDQYTVVWEHARRNLNYVIPVNWFWCSRSTMALKLQVLEYLMWMSNKHDC